MELRELIEQIAKIAGDRMKPNRPSLLIVDRETAHQLYVDLAPLEYDSINDYHKYKSDYQPNGDEKITLKLHIIDSPNKSLHIQVI